MEVEEGHTHRMLQDWCCLDVVVVVVAVSFTTSRPHIQAPNCVAVEEAHMRYVIDVAVVATVVVV